ncbi:hypothetical protein [Streptomyces sp. Wb2n-11]|uniref:hypothetical protein n=1 Tax=Streptomyces sp. Wb2n-11 TaxID=1030533 RepID=UPI000A735781|nr:hypothetical protein [Streptomyces sp. Wb2n-11]
MMAAGPAGEPVPTDWSRAAWDVLREEAESITALAGRLGLWTVFGSIHPLTPPNRPHNSLSASRSAVPYRPRSGQKLEE